MVYTPVQFIATEWVCIGFTLALVVLRSKLRWDMNGGRLALSDFFVIAAWLIFLSQGSMDTALLKLGLFDGKIHHSATVFGKQGNASYEDTVTALKIEYVEASIYYCQMYFVKAAMLSFYHSLIPPSLTKLRWLMWGTVGLMCAGWITDLGLSMFICQPIASNWTPGPAYCEQMTLRRSNNARWAFHIITDFLVYLIPLLLLKNVHLQRRTKIGVAFTFGIGFICIFFACMVQVSLIYQPVLTLIWLPCTLEQTWCIIVACCPAFKSLWIKDTAIKRYVTSGLRRVSLSTGSRSRSVSKPRKADTPSNATFNGWWSKENTGADGSMFSFNKSRSRSYGGNLGDGVLPPPLAYRGYDEVSPSTLEEGRMVTIEEISKSKAQIVITTPRKSDDSGSA